MASKTNELLEFAKVIYFISKETFPEYSGKFSRKTYTLPQIMAMICLMIKFKMTYRDFISHLELMPRLQEVLELKSIPHYTTLHKAMKRIDHDKINKMFAKTSRLKEPSGKAAIDSTFFQKGSASEHYLKRCDIHVKTQKAGIVIDTENLMILGVTLTNRRTHDTKLATKLLKNLLKWLNLLSLTGDKGFDSEPFRMALRNSSILPIIKYRVFEECHNLLNQVMDNLGYHSRSLIETVNSVLKRRYGDRLRSAKWFLQFKESKLKMAVYNVDRYLAICCIVVFSWLISPLKRVN
jgi:IS5 family transposase